MEGGGEGVLREDLRRAMWTLLRRANLARLPRIIACGPRDNAYRMFTKALRSGTHACMLLVDSEAPLDDLSPWDHLARRDGWKRPSDTRDDVCHLMVQVMETWFLVDRVGLSQYFGRGFKPARLPSEARHIEDLPKVEVLQSLGRASADCTAGAYRKSSHSFDLLARVEPNQLAAASPAFRSFLDPVRNWSEAAP